MSTYLDGGLLPADLILLMDGPITRQLKQIYSAMGLDAPGEATSGATKYTTGRASILGDGSTTYGISNAQFKNLVATRTERGANFSHYDYYFSFQGSDYWNDIDNWIRNTLPPTWSFSGDGYRPLDAALLRINANHAFAPATPATAATLIATTGGSRPAVASGSAMRIVWTLVGDRSWKESLPSPASTQVAIVSPNSAYKIDLSAVSGNIPSGVQKIRIYCQVDGSSGGDPYFYNKEVSVTAGTAYSTFTSGSPLATITEADSTFNKFHRPPVYCGAQALPEAAFAYAIINASAGSVPGSPMKYGVSSQFQPSNVALNPINGFLGIANSAAHGTLATWVATALTVGSIQKVNSYADRVQGFYGAVGGVQARTTATLNGTASITSIGYSYYDLTSPQVELTGTIAGPLSLTAAIDSTVDLAIPAGRVVTKINSNTVGTATTGTFVYEAKPLRAI